MTLFTGNWSFSSLMMYEGCALRFKLAKIDKIPEPPRPPDNPMERGNRIHHHLEAYVKGETDDFTNEARKLDVFRPLFDHARVLYSAKMATAEQNWLFDKDWEVCERDGVWLWAKLDLNVIDEHNGISIPIDYKSGKSQFKQFEHAQQLQLYSAAAALRQPWVETIHAELWYLDEGWVNAVEYTTEEALKFVGVFERRADRIYADKFFRPNANVRTCHWCPYGSRNGNGHCPVSV